MRRWISVGSCMRLISDFCVEAPVLWPTATVVSFSESENFGVGKERRPCVRENMTRQVEN